MPLYKKAEEWRHYTSLLLAARPTTTRITTKYTIRPAPSAAALEKSRAKRAARGSSKTTGSETTTTATESSGPRAVLELKTYCPESGVVLKYRTDKAAEVGRLIGTLGRMGRAMSGMEDREEKADVVMADAEEGPEKTLPAEQAQAQAQTQQGGNTGGGTQKKKKKGKR